MAGGLFNSGCCCGDTCAIETDDFDRTNSSSLGSKWTEESGSWDITSNQLRCTSPGTAVCTTVHPTGPEMTLAVNFRHDTGGRTIDLIVGRVDANNYFYARYTMSGAFGTVEIRKCASGVHTQLETTLATLSTNTTYAGQVCVDQYGKIFVSLDGAGLLYSDPQTITGTVAALASNFSGIAIFDNFVLNKTLTDTDTECAACPQVNMPCDQCSDQPPPSYQVVITGITNDNCSDCDDFNGTWIVEENAEGDECAVPEFSQDPCLRCVQLPATTCGATVIVLGYNNLSVTGRDPNAATVNGFSFSTGGAAGSCIGPFPDAFWAFKSSNGSQCDLSGATCDVTPI